MIILKVNPEWQKGQKGMDRKKGMTARKAAAWLLILAAVTVMAAGCGPKPGGAEAGGADAPTADNGGAGDNSDVPRGRYVEQELAFPFDPSTEMMEAMMLSPEGDLLVLTYNQEMENRIYRMEVTGEWNMDEAVMPHFTRSKLPTHSSAGLLRSSMRPQAGMLVRCGAGISTSLLIT